MSHVYSHRMGSEAVQIVGADGEPYTNFEVSIRQLTSSFITGSNERINPQLVLKLDSYHTEEIQRRFEESGLPLYISIEQADEALFRQLFGDPMVQSILCENPSVADALYRLVKNEWSTSDMHVLTDEYGYAEISGFRGGYIAEFEGGNMEFSL